MRTIGVVVMSGLALAAGSLGAQSRAGGTGMASAGAAVGQGRTDTIPTAYRPPRGMCRVWLTNVPANKQPAPTDCATAIKTRPATARVIFGDSVSVPKPGMPVPSKDRLPLSSTPPVVRPPIPPPPPPAAPIV